MEIPNLLEDIFLGVPAAVPGGALLAVAGAGGAALGAVQEIVPQHVLGLRVLPGALRVPPAPAAAPGPHAQARPGVLRQQPRLHGTAPRMGNQHLLLIVLLPLLLVLLLLILFLLLLVLPFLLLLLLVLLLLLFLILFLLLLLFFSPSSPEL